MSENQTVTEEFSYDVVAYPGLIIPQMNPDRLAAVAKLHGMNPAPAEKCRVLELGCGNGANLNWLAYGLPESEFVGVDLAQLHINEANKNKADLEIQNVTFFQQNVMEMSEKSFGKFDYIIAHGLFSWVPDFVREKILSLYDELLTPNGVGFISYNVYPGCYRRRSVADLMKFHTREIDNPVDKVRQGIDFVNFMTDQTKDSDVYHGILNYELKRLVKRPLENIYHDDFSEVNQPFYFTEFIAEAEKHNLQFLSESENFPSQRDNLPPEVNQVFENICQNNIEYEQYSDFYNCRRFRQTLLCKKDAVLDTEIKPLRLKDIYISSLVRPTSATIDLNPDSAKEFLTDKGDRFEVSHNLTKMILAFLVNTGAHLATLDELAAKSREMLQAQGISYDDFEKEVEITASLLIQLYSPNAIGFHTIKPNAVAYVSEKPAINKFALWQLNHGLLATNFHGVGMNVQEAFIHALLNLLDGTRTRDDLIVELTKHIHSDEEIEDKENFIANLPETLEQHFFVLAKMGFLIV